MKKKVKEKQREDMFMFQLRCLLLIIGSTVRHSTQSFLLSVVLKSLEGKNQSYF